ncbi:hypothetical protein [Vreelandella malpeensis]|uniref:Uncharacterized protein n=1 Tax=Vreelandella malpeensis TaxID=1172368 RepID=A0ABS8DUA2_9GAMM|nr:hypothetical protein [Halomonas malpeensis]MCB8889907.1 hypothetical protein [Halomonas malpeensis]
MDKVTYHARWDALEQRQREQSNLPESGVEDATALHRMLTHTFREFLIAAYCDHWRHVYASAAFDLTSDREVLIARAVTVHGWTPGVSASLSTQDLALSLIHELARFTLPEMAVHVSYMNLQALPAAQYRALIEPHE